MSRYTIFTDVAGWDFSAHKLGGDRMTAAAVAVATTELDSFRQKVHLLPKWSECTYAQAKTAIHLLRARAASVSIVTMTEESEAWKRFCKITKLLQEEIVRQHRHPAGFVKPANVTRFALLRDASALAIAHAVKISRSINLLDFQCRELIEQTIVCDSDIQGDENISVFKSFWQISDQHQQNRHKLGLHFFTRDVQVATEQQEPLLLMADYAAGIGHSAFTPNPGRLPFPVAHEFAKEQLKELHKSGKLVSSARPFDINGEEVFSDALLVAEKRRQDRKKTQA